MTSTVGKSTNIRWHDCPVNQLDRQKLLNQKGCVVWITGLSGSGMHLRTLKILTGLHCHIWKLWTYDIWRNFKINFRKKHPCMCTEPWAALKRASDLCSWRRQSPARPEQRSQLQSRGSCRKYTQSWSVRFQNLALDDHFSVGVFSEKLRQCWCLAL